MRVLPALLAALLLLLPSASGAEEQAGGFEVGLKELVERVNGKLKSGAVMSPADIETELAEFDALIERYPKENKDTLAHVALLKASLRTMVLSDEQSLDALKKVVANYPDTPAAVEAKRFITPIERRLDGEKIRASLEVGKPFPPFVEKGLDGKEISLEALRGKVVLIDFWATWCSPCLSELGDVRATYQKYRDKGLEIVGISLDQDQVALEALLRRRDITWPQYFDGQGWNNRLAVKYGITSIPMTYLLNRDGVIVAKDIRGSKLLPAVAAALEK